MFQSFLVAWRRPTLAEAKPRLPSALESLTSVFGMGTGVTSPLSLPDILNLKDKLYYKLFFVEMQVLF